MFAIETQEMSQQFFQIWQAAVAHLGKRIDGGNCSWLRAHPYSPFLEHISFLLGNQSFFVRVTDMDEKVIGPGNESGLLAVAEGCGGYPCLMPMKHKLLGGWVPEYSGWGLIDSSSRKPIDPVSFITDEKIEMTPWEIQDFAVQIVKQQMEREGYQLMSWQGNPGVDPSIWFVGSTGEPECVVVRAAKYPDNRAPVPMKLREIVASCKQKGAEIYFASVAFASIDQPFKSDNETPVPLWRGYGVHPNFGGLERLGK